MLPVAQYSSNERSTLCTSGFADDVVFAHGGWQLGLSYNFNSLSATKARRPRGINRKDAHNRRASL